MSQMQKEAPIRLFTGRFNAHLILRSVRNHTYTATLLTLCWRLPLLFTDYIKNWLLSMEKNVFDTNHLAKNKTQIKQVFNTSQ